MKTGPPALTACSPMNFTSAFPAQSLSLGSSSCSNALWGRSCLRTSVTQSLSILLCAPFSFFRAPVQSLQQHLLPTLKRLLQFQANKMAIHYSTCHTKHIQLQSTKCKTRTMDSNKIVLCGLVFPRSNDPTLSVYTTVIIKYLIWQQVLACTSSMLAGNSWEHTGQLLISTWDLETINQKPGI